MIGRIKHKPAVIIFHGYRWSVRMVLASVVLAAFALGLARLFLPTVIEYRPDIEKLAQEVLQAPVAIAQIETGWHGVTPVITLKGIDIKGLGDSDNQLHLRSLDIAISPLSSLLAWELRPSQVVLKMHELNVRRLQDGSLNFRLGYKEQAEEDLLDKDTMQWLLEQPDLHIEVSRLALMDDMQIFPPLKLSDIDLVFKKEGADLVASFDASATDLANRVKAIIRLEDVVNLEKGHPVAQAYIQLGRINLDTLRKFAQGKYGLPDTGQVDLEMWADFSVGKLDRMQGNWRASDISYAPGNGMPAFIMDTLQTGFIWQRKAGGWQLELNGLQMARAGHQWPEANLSVDLDRKGESRYYLINMDYMHLGDILSIALQQPDLPEAVRKKLIASSPSGELTGLKMQLSYEEGKVSQYGFQVDIKDLAFKADGEFPGVTGIDGYVAATEKAGLFRASTEGARLHMPKVFRESLALDIVNGKVNWSKLDDGLLIESPELTVENAHLKTQSRLSLHLPDKGSPFVDLQTNFREGDGSHTSLYLPAFELDEEALEWLDKGIVAGNVEYGTFVLHGALEDFPYDRRDGKFEVRFKVRDGILDYYEDWPVIDEIEAEVVFSGRSMHIEATAGKIFSADIRSAIVDIPNLDADNPLLGIRGAVQTSSADLMRYLQETKLTGDYREAFSFMSLKGDHRLNLNLDIPLSKGDVRFDGGLSFTGNQLDIPSWQVALKGVQGQLNFTEDKFEASDIKADFEGFMTSINVSTRYVAKGRETLINADTRADLSTLLAHGSKGLASLVEGVSPVRVDISVPDYDDGKSRLVASSTLLGTSINLPRPLGKAIDTELPLVLATGFEGEAASKIDIEIGDEIKAAIAIDEKESRFDGVALYFGEISFDELYQRAKGKAYIGGKIPSLSVNEWVDWYDSLPASDESVAAFPILAEMQVDRLNYARWFMKDVGVKTQQSKAGWEIDLLGDSVNGHIVVPADNRSALLARLPLLSLYKEESKEAPASVKQPGGKIEQASGLLPEDIPSIDMQVEKLLYQSRELGSLHAGIQSQQNELTIDYVALKNEQTETSLTGSWIYDPKGNQHKTSLELKQSSTDFGNFLTRHGFEDTIKKGKSEVKASITADVPLPDISSKKINGKARFDLDKGEIVELDPGGVGRIFGLFSFQALPRRLILDFRDLFSTGMSFDDIDGNFTFNNGQAYTNNLIMEAPSSRIEVSGRIGLADEDYDQSIRVIPKVSSTLPVAGALAGGPGLAVVMYITHKLLKDPINKFSETEYRLTGPWRNPEITKLESKDKAVASKNKKQDSREGTDEADSL